MLYKCISRYEKMCLVCYYILKISHIIGQYAKQT